MSTSALLDALYLAGLAATAPYHAWRLIANKPYRAGLRERWGHIAPTPGDSRVLWMHCSSVGEAMLARRLVPALEAGLPGWRVELSSSTETGYNTALRQLGVRSVFRHPFDLSWVVRRALKAVRPGALLLMEREIWPQLVLAAAEREVPVALINARRFSERSLWWYRRLGGISERMLQGISLYLAQDERDAAFFRRLGIPEGRLNVVGNLKYDNVTVGCDAAAAEQLRMRLGWPADAPVWVAGSTHEGEEQLLLEVYRRLRTEHPDLKLVMAPRYPDRVARVERLLSGSGVESARWSTLKQSAGAGGARAAAIVDTFGDLAAFYAIGSVVFVGGSFIAHGGHNVIEPAALGQPVLVGPHHENNAEAVQFLSAAGALRVVHDADEAAEWVSHFLSDREAARAAGRSGQEAIRKRQGACERHVQALRAWLSVSHC